MFIILYRKGGFISSYKLYPRVYDSYLGTGSGTLVRIMKEIMLLWRGSSIYPSFLSISKYTQERLQCVRELALSRDIPVTPTPRDKGKSIISSRSAWVVH